MPPSTRFAAHLPSHSPPLPPQPPLIPIVGGIRYHDLGSPLSESNLSGGRFGEDLLRSRIWICYRQIWIWRRRNLAPPDLDLLPPNLAPPGLDLLPPDLDLAPPNLAPPNLAPPNLSLLPPDLDLAPSNLAPPNLAPPDLDLLPPNLAPSESGAAGLGFASLNLLSVANLPQTSPLIDSIQTGANRGHGT